MAVTIKLLKYEWLLENGIKQEGTYMHEKRRWQT